MHEKTISIWFFIGVLLLLYGVLILGYGIYRLVAGLPTTTVLGELYPDIWWGALMTIVGATYSVKFSPRKR